MTSSPQRQNVPTLTFGAQDKGTGKEVRRRQQASVLRLGAQSHQESQQGCAHSSCLPSPFLRPGFSATQLNMLTPGNTVGGPPTLESPSEAVRAVAACPHLLCLQGL